MNPLQQGAHAPTSRLRIVFAGTPEFALPCLEAVLASGHDLIGVYTQPDRRSGRGQSVTGSPIRLRAAAAQAPVFQPATLRDPAARRELEGLRPDLIIVVAYGLILTSQVLAIPRFGCWNVHASALPRWRGAAPIQRALLAGDSETGVDLMQMEKGLDTGPVLLSRRTDILSDDTGGSLHDRLSLLGGDLLSEGLRRLGDGTLPPARPQSSLGITYAAKIDKAEAVLDLRASAAELERKIRAFHPWPIAETVVASERVRVHSAIVLSCRHNQPAGTLLATGRDGIDLACGDGALRLVRLQRDGGRPISALDYLNARPELRALA